VRGPARVADAVAAGDRLLAQVARQLGDAPCTLAHVELVAGQSCQVGAIVAAILEPAQPLDQDRFRFLVAHVADNAAHVLFFLELKGIILGRRVPTEYSEAAAWENGTSCRGK